MLLYQELSNQILNAYFEVLRCLGTGLLEKVYENALCVEFDQMGIPYECQKPLKVVYKGQEIGHYVADIVVDGKIIIELKSVSQLVPAHSAQLLNYLTITGVDVGYLLNFGDGRDYKRVISKQALMKIDK